MRAPPCAASITQLDSELTEWDEAPKRFGEREFGTMSGGVASRAEVHTRGLASSTVGATSQSRPEPEYDGEAK